MDTCSISDRSTVPQAAVACRGLTKSFRSAAGTVWALRGIDLDIPKGGIVMLVGPSGCGKTTLISVIAGILSADDGSCVVFGQPLGSLRGNALLSFRARSIGFIFQQFHLVPSLSIADNVSIPLIINGVDRLSAVAAAHRMLSEVGLDERGDDHPAVLSGGQQQRVAIARALVHAPPLIVCDEPTSALDHDTGQRVMELLRQMSREKGTTVLIVTHDSRIFPYADRIAHMDDGRIVDLQDVAPEGGAS